jgi:hypothetical protein
MAVCHSFQSSRKGDPMASGNSFIVMITLIEKNALADAR